MRWGIFGDCHGNRHGLEAVLAALESERCDRLLCLGDVVGYGADPNACCDLVRGRAEICLLGNHDQAALGQCDLTWFNTSARISADWTFEHLDPDHRAWLASLQPRYDAEGFLAVHGALPGPLDWGYVVDAAGAAATLAACEAQVVVVGHSHLAEAYAQVRPDRLERVSFWEDGAIKLASVARFVLNPGSCGQPRDRQPRAAYAVLDLRRRTFAVRRLDYDVRGAARAILDAGLPTWLAARLYEGR
jgi:predicted phosphodiesterase